MCTWLSTKFKYQIAHQDRQPRSVGWTLTFGILVLLIRWNIDNDDDGEVLEPKFMTTFSHQTGKLFLQLKLMPRVFSHMDQESWLVKNFSSTGANWDYSIKRNCRLYFCVCSVRDLEYRNIERNIANCNKATHFYVILVQKMRELRFIIRLYLNSK